MVCGWYTVAARCFVPRLYYSVLKNLLTNWLPLFANKDAGRPYWMTCALKKTSATVFVVIRAVRTACVSFDDDL